MKGIFIYSICRNLFAQVSTSFKMLLVCLAGILLTDAQTSQVTGSIAFMTAVIYIVRKFGCGLVPKSVLGSVRGQILLAIVLSFWLYFGHSFCNVTAIFSTLSPSACQSFSN